jgi:hypothetical protein
MGVQEHICRRGRSEIDILGESGMAVPAESDGHVELNLNLYLQIVCFQLLLAASSPPFLCIALHVTMLNMHVG